MHSRLRPGDVVVPILASRLPAHACIVLCVKSLAFFDGGGAQEDELVEVELMFSHKTRTITLWLSNLERRFAFVAHAEARP